MIESELLMFMLGGAAIRRGGRGQPLDTRTQDRHIAGLHHGRLARLTAGVRGYTF